MALFKQLGRAVPINPLELLKAIGRAEKQSTRECELTILVDTSLDPALLSFAKQALQPLTENLNLVVTPFFDEPPVLAQDSGIVVVLAAESPATGHLMAQALREQRSAIAVTLDAELLHQIAYENGYYLDSSAIITAPLGELSDGEDAEDVRFAKLFDALGAWMVRTLPDERLALARALDFVRTPFIKDATQSIAVQNAAIAAVFFLPGADMPLLTLNQMRLFLQIAAAYDATLDTQRLKELAVVLLGGFGFRGITRRLVGVVPVLGWAIRGTVGYTGTLAVSKAAQEYFKAIR